MYTSMMGLAISAILGSSAPDFQTDYKGAKDLAARNHKPLAVVLSSGEAAWNGIVPEGGLNEATLKILRESYVCVYVDTGSERGRKLATDFDLKGGPALIISDRSAEVQAYRHDGPLTGVVMTDLLRQYANPDRVVSRTDETPTHTVAPAFFNPLQQCLT